MSLKAYDGMMSRKSIKYIQDEITKNIDRFRDASENKLAKKYAKLFVEHFDGEMDIKNRINFDAQNEVKLDDEIKKIEIKDNTIILSYIYQVSKILSKGYFVNDFMAHLNISLQAINNKKILIYPSIIVNEHKQILLEFLEDWYCQNQCDADENVKKQQWKQREKDWYNFNEIPGFSMKIQLFDPTDFMKSLNSSFRGDKLINKILKYIPSDEKRIRKIAKSKVINNIEKEANDKGEKMSIWNIIDRISNKENTEIDDYIKNNNIEIVKIDFDFIKTATFNEKILESKS